MSYQMKDAAEGKEFRPTYIGRHLKEKFEQYPRYKKRVPKRWITMEYVEEVVINDNKRDIERNTAYKV